MLTVIPRHLILATLITLTVLTPILTTHAQESTPNTFVGSQKCIACHKTESDQWQGSSHEKAMAEANSSSVLGDFNNAKFSANGVTTTFFKKDSTYWVKTDGPDGKLTDYQISYTFGSYPLQQYLIKFPKGKIQALNIAWDSRPKAVGGARWFHLYPTEKIDHKDILHWTRVSQNWNFMCAECHSTNLQKNYDPAAKTFNTTWSEINVSCEACHGPGSQHIKWTETPETTRNKTNTGIIQSLKLPPFNAQHDPVTGKTLPNIGHKSSGEIDSCAQCHSRRSSITQHYESGQPLLDTHLPSLLNEEHYQVDGQIKEEVYEYGSFLQSKMYVSGVTCSNCHEPHSLKLRAPGNAVCAQCHTPEKYDNPKHHFHKSDSSGSDCKSCHMPQKTFMGVDTRYDHSMRIPQPAFEEALGTSSACLKCHTEKNFKWAENQVRTWYGPAEAHFQNYGAAFAAARKGDPNAGQDLLSIINNSTKPAIVRATALEELGHYLDPTKLETLKSSSQSSDALVRLATLFAITEAPPQIQVSIATPLLADPIRAVRIEAARLLARYPEGDIPPDISKNLKKASDEYEQSQLANAESPQAQLNLGLFYSAKQRLEDAEKAYRTAIEIEPNFIPAYINLADLKRSTGDDKQGKALILEAIKQSPNSGDAHYSLGLFYVRAGDKQKALPELEAAAKLQPNNAHYSYTYILLLNDLGKKHEAQKVLKDAVSKFPNDPEIAALQNETNANH